MNVSGQQACCRSRRVRVQKQASAILIVLILLACMVVFVTVNTKTLYVLKEELGLIDEQQQKKYEQKLRH